MSEIVIKKEFDTTQSDDFCKYIVDINYDLDSFLNDESDILWFKFNYDNPFSTSLSYNDGGYLKDAGSLFLVYVDATPLYFYK